MHHYVLDFAELDRTHVALAGGKGANLGELSHVDGVDVPDGFCVTTDAFRQIIAQVASIDDRLARLSQLEPEDRDAIRTLSAEVRATIETTPMPADVSAAITRALAKHGAGHAYAVRSSATAEDLPTASFAGQQDTYLNIIGTEAILAHVSKCWASLFTERAVTYRLRLGFDQRKVSMAVVVQRMAFSQAAGILFTADPITGHRKIVSIEASFGLGEALVSGIVNADVYKVRDGAIISKAIGSKQRAIYPSDGGGTRDADVGKDEQTRAALTDAQIVRLAELGRRIEAHFGRPQDVEWCLVDENFLIVQARPITTLFPIPEITDGEMHVFVSAGHQQMMTDAMKPLGIAFWQLLNPMLQAGGRVFVDITRTLALPEHRAGLLALFTRGDPLIGDALRTVIERDVIKAPVDDGRAQPPLPPGVVPSTIPTDPEIVTSLIEGARASIAAARERLAAKSGTELIDAIVADIPDMKRVLFDPHSRQAIMAGMEAFWWLNDHLKEWLGESNAADALTQSVPHNITSEMGLELLDVADVIRPHPQVIAFLQRTSDDNFLDELPKLEGGREARDAILGWLAKHGMRAVGEIDITRPRWSERPTMLLPALLGNIQSAAPGEARRRFEQGLATAAKKEREVLQRLRALPDGEAKAEETKRMIDRVRTFSGYREFPKYGMISRYFVYKQALMKEAERLVAARVLREKEDMFYLTVAELREVIRTQQADEQLIRRRKEEFRVFETLTPPRMFTSEGEIITGSYRRENVPTGALVGLAVSAGTVEGRARVIRDVSEADLEAGDILVTAFTDPSWTPVFVAIKGLVTEVGGLMTHGAVIAREYGLPAVVGVENATRLIRDGQRIRVHGSDGYVEIL